MAYAIDGQSDKDWLVIPNRHVNAFVDLSPPEKQLCMNLVDRVIDKIRCGGHDQFHVSGFDGIHDDHCRISITLQ